MALMLAWSDDFRAVFWVAVIPAMLSFALVVLAVQEPRREAKDVPADSRVRLIGLGTLGAPFWWIVAAAVALSLARFSEAFLLLRANDVGVDVAYAPLVLVGMNMVYSFTAYPVGRLADRMPARTLLIIGIAWLVAADVALARAQGLVLLAAGVIGWGLHMGFTQGLLSALVARHAPPERRGTAFGIFNLAMGIAMLIASAIAGALWQYVGPGATFWSGAALALVAALVTAAASARA
jgi:predicted MFS family arabinose efflux permease